MVADLAAAREFAAQWAGKGYEKGECQKIWTLLLRSLRFLDIFFFDWFLLCRSKFFPHFYPKVKASLGPHLFGYNKKGHLIHVIAILVGSAVLASLCVWVQ